MAIDDADSFAGHDGVNGEAPDEEASATRGEYTWADYLREYGSPGAATALYERVGLPEERDAEPEPSGITSRLGIDRSRESEEPVDPALTREDWERVDDEPSAELGFHPTETDETVEELGERAVGLRDFFEAFCDPETTPVVKDVWMWEHYKREYYYEPDGSRPRDEEGDLVRFDEQAALGFEPDDVEPLLAAGADAARQLEALVDDRTVDVDESIDEDAFFSNADGTTTVANRYDLEKAVPMEKKRHFREEERYWVNKPYAFVVVFRSTKENERKYYAVEPYMNRIETDVVEYLTGKLRTSIKYADDGVAENDEQRRAVIEGETYDLLERYDLYDRAGRRSPVEALAERLSLDGADDGPAGRILRALGYERAADPSDELDGILARPEPAVLAEDAETLTEYQVEKLQYFLRRDFIGFERIDPIKHDVNVEDVSCDGYNSPVFVYHSDYEQIISNVFHGEKELDDFVVKLAQRSGKGISRRQPQVDATLPDGSRAQLTLGRDVSDHGTNYTIRQFKDVPFTPVDLICWRTFSLDQMAFLWLCIENHKSLIFAGGTASGKTTSLNAVSLFIPSNSKIVSIEDTREVELPQRNWIASVTRPSFSGDDKGDVDEFDLLEAALRQRPDYIVMGEIRGEEGRTLFQVMSTGHTTYTTFHADNVGEVLKRFTTAPINVSKTMFTALDLVSIQTSTRVRGSKVRRNKSLTEINHYDAENDEINVQDVYQWQAESDQFLAASDSNTLDEIKFDRGWDQATLDRELFKRRTVLAYLLDRGFNSYTQVAATFQAFINDPDTILALMADDELERSLEDLREMESVLIDIDPEKEALVPRPDPDEEQAAEAREILDRAEAELFPDYRDSADGSVADALPKLRPGENVEATGETEPAFADDAPDEPLDPLSGFYPDETDVGPGLDDGLSALDGAAADAADATSGADSETPDGPEVGAGGGDGPSDSEAESGSNADDEDDKFGKWGFEPAESEDAE